MVLSRHVRFARLLSFLTETDPDIEGLIQGNRTFASVAYGPDNLKELQARVKAFTAEFW